MANAVQKITLASSRDIPFNKLVLSQSNVRRVKTSVSIEELAESIARRGLIQSLHVRPVLDADGKETGMFEVPAGGRRYRALELLIKQKRLAKAAPVPCVVGNAQSDILIDEVSLVENIDRAPLHPLDQFRAFQVMREKGMTEEAIAAAFFVGVNVVKQRLRLASVSPKLLDVYAEDGMTLEMLMAFTVSPDHARQEQVWEMISNGWQKEPWQIRRMLTETSVSVSDKRAVFVGVDAYEAAGGVVLRDLFEEDEGGWLQDVVLLDRLTAEKLKAAADEIAAEGWKWVEAAVSHPYGASHGFRALSGTIIDLTDEERVTREALRSEYDRLEAEYAEADELPDEIDQRLGEIEAALDAFEKRPVRYDPTDIAIAGVFVSIDTDGLLLVERGFVRPEDERPDGHKIGDLKGEAQDVAGEPIETVTQHAIVTISGQSAELEEEDDGIKPLPDRLISELTAYRTLALQNAVAGNPGIAMTALLHKFASDTFRHHPATGALDANIRQVSFPAQGDDLKDCPAAKSVADRHEYWGNRVPADNEGLWDWLTELDNDNRMALLAHCVSYGVNALYERPNPYSGSGLNEQALKVRRLQADRLARTTGLNIIEAGWRPTVNNYLGRVTKARIHDAVREGAGARAAQLIEHLKKGDMAKEAERLLADSHWLPEPLRTPQEAEVNDTSASEAAIVETANAEGESAMGDDDGIANTDEADDVPHVVTAE